MHRAVVVAIVALVAILVISILRRRAAEAAARPKQIRPEDIVLVMLADPDGAATITDRYQVMVNARKPPTIAIDGAPVGPATATSAGVYTADAQLEYGGRYSVEATEPGTPTTKVEVRFSPPLVLASQTIPGSISSAALLVGVSTDVRVTWVEVLAVDQNGAKSTIEAGIRMVEPYGFDVSLPRDVRSAVAMVYGNENSATLVRLKVE